MSEVSENVEQPVNSSKTPKASQSELTWGDAGILFGLSLVLGVGVGFVAENNTNEVARGKVKTAETCLKVVSAESTVTEEMDRCLHEGVPGGNEIDDDKFEVGDPIEYVYTYIEAQEDEARQIELGRIVGWSAAPLLTVGGIIVVFG